MYLIIDILNLEEIAVWYLGVKSEFELFAPYSGILAAQATSTVEIIKK